MKIKSDSWKQVYKKFKRADRKCLVKLRAIIESSLSNGLDEISYIITSHDSLVVLNGERYDANCERIILRQKNEKIEYEYGAYDKDNKQNLWMEPLIFDEESGAFLQLSSDIHSWVKN
jgi:hypothetical protein